MKTQINGATSLVRVRRDTSEIDIDASTLDDAKIKPFHENQTIQFYFQFSRPFVRICQLLASLHKIVPNE